MPSPSQMRKLNEMKRNAPAPDEEVQLPNPLLQEAQKAQTQAHTFDPRAPQNQPHQLPHSAGQVCVFCLFQDGDDRTKKTVILNGDSVCLDHAPFLYETYTKKNIDIINEMEAQEWRDIA